MKHRMLKPLFLVGNLFSQLLNAQPIQGNVYDNVTKGPVSYALVTNMKRTVGLSTDSLGFFKITPNVSLQFDSLQISAIGYKPVLVVVEETKPLIVYLEKIIANSKSKPLQLNKKFSKPVKIGALRNLEDGSFGGAVDSGNECSTLIINPDKRVGKIKKISFFILDDGIYNTPFRIRVYQNNNDKPGEEITTKNIIVRGYNKNAWNKFDVSQYDLVLPLKGCFISMEWLNWGEKYQYEMTANSGDMGYGQSIGLTSEFPFSASFMRNNGSVWKTWEEWWGLTSDSVLRLPTVYTPMIRVEVYY